MQRIENTPEMLALKEILREFFLGLINNIKGAFIGFYEWISGLRLNMPPMLKFLGGTKISGILFAIFIAYVLFINIKGYLIFAADKRYAEAGEERVPEWRLLAHIWLGGTVGSAIAMYRLRHKTQHKLFKASVVLCLLIYLLFFSAVVGFLGFWTFF